MIHRNRTRVIFTVSLKSASIFVKEYTMYREGYFCKKLLSSTPCVSSFITNVVDEKKGLMDLTIIRKGCKKDRLVEHLLYYN